MSPLDLVEREEARLREELRREQDSNRHYAARCPGMKETDCYQAGPLSPTRFYNTRDYLAACIKREHARFNLANCPTRRGR